MIDLYTWTAPNGRKVSIMLEEIGMPYAAIPVDIQAGEQFAPEFLKPWIARYEWQGIDWVDYPSLKRWYLAIASCPAVQRGYDVPSETGPIPMPA